MKYPTPTHKFYPASSGMSKPVQEIEVPIAKRTSEIPNQLDVCDASDPAFWQKGINVVSGFIDELEKM